MIMTFRSIFFTFADKAASNGVSFIVRHDY